MERSTDSSLQDLPRIASHSARSLSPHLQPKSLTWLRALSDGGWGQPRPCVQNRLFVKPVEVGHALFLLWLRCVGHERIAAML